MTKVEISGAGKGLSFKYYCNSRKKIKKRRGTERTRERRKGYTHGVSVVLESENIIVWRNTNRL
jgi:hypothetical protein